MCSMRVVAREQEPAAGLALEPPARAPVRARRSEAHRHRVRELSLGDGDDAQRDGDPHWREGVCRGEGMQHFHFLFSPTVLFVWTPSTLMYLYTVISLA